MNGLKGAILGSLSLPGFKWALQPWRRGVGTIFMLHRFNDPDTGARGDDPEVLRHALAYLRRHRYELVDLAEFFRRLQEGDPRRDLGVAFTLDDGYRDQVEVAGPVFAEFDCPATVFVTTGFVDRRLWQWWDRIEYVFEQAPRTNLEVELGGALLPYRWDSTTGLASAQADFIARCKLVPDAEKHAAILRLAAAAGVELPADAPRQYQPMTWENLVAWERRGMRFGPHTVHHPILSRTSDEQSRSELREAWTRLSAVAASPTPVFCYPNGQPEDFGHREIDTLREIGLIGAVVGSPGYAEVEEFRARREAPFLVRRFSFPADDRHVARFVTGAERILHGTGRAS
jgi:peptidoglycan/xylan/chitin deacetylase (PgdA/CDA1 family)